MDEEGHASDESMNSETEENSSSSSSSSSSTESDGEVKTAKITLKARKDRRSRGKWKLLSSTKKKFKKEWLIKYTWVEKDAEDSQLAFCKVCKFSMRAVKNTLESHQKSKKHFRNLEKPAHDESMPTSDSKKENKFVDSKSINAHPQQQQQQQQPSPPPQPQPQPPPQPQHFIPPPPTQPAAIGIDQITDEQISFFAESQADAAHQAVTSIIDKLVEKYHENRLINLKIQNDAIYELNAERAKIVRTVNQKKLERRLQLEAYKKEVEQVHLRNLITEHETKMHAMERERDAKLRAVEQELVFAKQEYERKVRLLDSQLSSMK